MPVQPEAPALADLKRYALRRSLFAKTTLAAAIARLGFVQADPIRAPARAQDLILLQRVRGYRAGDLERRYPRLAIEEDFFINYGFVNRPLHALMHPRERGVARSARQRQRSQELLAFVQERDVVHPREVDRHFAHGRVTNYWGGLSSATTHLLDDMHYRGLLRIAGRDNGIRLYAVRAASPASSLPSASRASAIAPVPSADPQARLDALVDAAVALYAPVPQATLTWLVRRLRHAAPQWQSRLDVTLRRAKARLGQARVNGVHWYWPTDENPAADGQARRRRRRPSARVNDLDNINDVDDVEYRVRFLAPFDPVVWDRRRFELFWGWAYRFEAYTPKTQRKLGYYALPLLWGDEVIGWGNLAVQDDALVAQVGFAAARPVEAGFASALAAELERFRECLGVARVVQAG